MAATFHLQARDYETAESGRMRAVAAAEQMGDSRQIERMRAVLQVARQRAEAAQKPQTP